MENCSLVPMVVYQTHLYEQHSWDRQQESRTRYTNLPTNAFGAVFRTNWANYVQILPGNEKMINTVEKLNLKKELIFVVN